MEREKAKVLELIKLGALVLSIHVLLGRLLPLFLKLLPKLI